MSARRPSSHWLAPRQVAIDAVRAACRVCRAVQQNLVSTDTLSKKDRSPVTVADFASQAVICEMLGRVFPDDVIVGEEQADALRQDNQQALLASVTEHVAAGLGNSTIDEAQVLNWIDRGGTSSADSQSYWTVDPIDGTKGFLRGEQYVVALALLVDQQVVLGVLGCPNLPCNGSSGSLMVAIQGGGTSQLPLDDEHCQGSLVHVSNMNDSATSRFCESVESGHSSHDDAARIAEHLGITTEPLRMDSQAKYAAVARGDAQIYLRLPTSSEYRENIWDHAAGCIVVTEAGGRVSDTQGQDLEFTHGRRLEANRGIVATNGLLHHQVLDAIASTSLHHG